MCAIFRKRSPGAILIYSQFFMYRKHSLINGAASALMSIRAPASGCSLLLHAPRVHMLLRPPTRLHLLRVRACAPPFPVHARAHAGPCLDLHCIYADAHKRSTCTFTPLNGGTQTVMGTFKRLWTGKFRITMGTSLLMCT